MAKILVVDDDAQVRSTIGRLLSVQGHEISEAPNGAVAADAIARSPFDLLIIDLVMPDQGGIETIMRIHVDSKSIPTIVMSGKIPINEEAVNRLVERYGAKGVLAKPFTSEELAEVVNKALDD